MRGLLAEPVTFGDYALPNRRIEGRPRAETSRIGHMARAGKRVVLTQGSAVAPFIYTLF